MKSNLPPVLQVETVSQYLKHAGSQCPHCEVASLDFLDEAVVDGTATFFLSCNSCGASWVEYYTLQDYGQVNLPGVDTLIDPLP